MSSKLALHFGAILAALALTILVIVGTLPALAHEPPGVSKPPASKMSMKPTAGEKMAWKTTNRHGLRR
jgi:hypothetical protein